VRVPVPRHLSRDGKLLFRLVAREYEIDDPSGVRILRLACEAYDRCQAARRQIDGEGLTVKDRYGQIRPHPLLTVERDARAACLACLKALHLDLEPLRDAVGRPPLTGGE